MSQILSLLAHKDKSKSLSHFMSETFTDLENRHGFSPELVAENLNRALLYETEYKNTTDGSSDTKKKKKKDGEIDGDGNDIEMKENNNDDNGSHEEDPLQLDYESEVMSSLEEMVKHTATLIDTLREFDDPEGKLATELGILP